MKTKFLLLFKAILILFFVFIQNQKNEKLDFTNSGIDFWEYQTVATNLAEYNQFPTLGFIGEKEEYFDKQPYNSPKDAYVFCRFENFNPVPFFEKPPLFGFVLGLTYKVFNNNVKIAYYLNLFLFSLSFLVLYGISKLFFKNEILSILLVGLALFFSPLPHLASIAPFYLLFLGFNTLTLFTLKFLKTKKTTWLVLYSLAFALSLLTNGIYIFYLAFTLFVLIFKSGGPKSYFLKSSILFTLISLLVLPWLIFANYTIKTNKEAFNQAEKEILSSTSICSNNTEDLINYFRDIELMKQIVEKGAHHKIVNSFFDGYYSFKNITFFSNQVKSDDFLAIHNELSLDGGLHFEWESNPNLFYNKLEENSSSFSKIASFYKENPSYTYKIYLAKSLNATQQFPSIYLLLLTVTLLVMLPQKLKLRYVITVAMSCLLFIVLSKSSFIITSSFLILLLSPFYFIFSKNSKNLVFVGAIHSLIIVLLLFYGAERFIIFMLPFLLLQTLSIINQLLPYNRKNN